MTVSLVDNVESFNRTLFLSESRTSAFSCKMNVLSLWLSKRAYSRISCSGSLIVDNQTGMIVDVRSLLSFWTTRCDIVSFGASLLCLISFASFILLLSLFFMLSVSRSSCKQVGCFPLHVSQTLLFLHFFEWCPKLRPPKHSPFVCTNLTLCYWIVHDPLTYVNVMV